MSRVGKMPVTVPAGVEVTIATDKINVKGSGGSLSVAANALVQVKNEAGVLSFAPADESREANGGGGW